MINGLIFNYGVMGSSKSANLLMTKFEYEKNGFNVYAFKSAIDNRDGIGVIKSRTGLECSAQVFNKKDLFVETLRMLPSSKEKPIMVFVDEAQFLTSTQVEDLKKFTLNENARVMCYGLKTDFRTKLFEGSARLLELADEVNELVVSCACGKHKASVSARIIDNKVITEGKTVQIGGNESYQAMCYDCWQKAIMKDKNAWDSLYIPNEAVVNTYEGSSMIKMPETSKYKGYVFYHNNKLIKEDKKVYKEEVAEEGIKVLFKNDSNFYLRKNLEKIVITANEFRNEVQGTIASDYHKYGKSSAIPDKQSRASGLGDTFLDNKNLNEKG